MGKRCGSGDAGPRCWGQADEIVFHSLLLCNGSRAGDTFPLLLNVGAGTTMCIVIYKYSKSLLGPTCVNLVFALASFFPVVFLHLSFCLHRLCETELSRHRSPAPSSIQFVLLPSPSPAVKGVPWELAAHRTPRAAHQIHPSHRPAAVPGA